MRRASFAVLVALALTVTLAGCSGPTSTAPDFQASPSGQNIEGDHAVHISPVVPVPAQGAGGSTVPGGSSSSRSPAQGSDPLVVATHLSAPVGLALLPDGSALVGERTTGRIVRVQPRAGQPVPTVRTVPGLSTVGGGGLLDLAVSPDYAEDSLIYAYVTTATDNRVVDFTLTGPITPVLTGIPKGTSDNGGRIAFGADGDLYIGTGDAGNPALAADPNSLAGKVLRVDDIGKPAPGNPRPSSPIFTTGQREVTGLCASGATMLEVQHGAGGRAQVNVVVGGADYGYPRATARSRAPVVTLPATGDDPGGCAVLNSRLWVASLGGQALTSAMPSGSADASFGSFMAVLAHRYGRLRTVVAASDGALWLTTSNRDGNGRPVPSDERVIRYLPQNSAGPGSTV